MIQFMIRSIVPIDASMCMYGRVSVHDLPEVLAWRRLSPRIQDESLRRGQSSVPKSTPLPSLAHSTHHTPAQMMTITELFDKTWTTDKFIKELSDINYKNYPKKLSSDINYPFRKNNMAVISISNKNEAVKSIYCLHYMAFLTKKNQNIANRQLGKSQRTHRNRKKLTSFSNFKEKKTWP